VQANSRRQSPRNQPKIGDEAFGFAVSGFFIWRPQQ
jgi:hypothetical protein